MFGRGKTGMTENQKFIMAKGRQVGNLKGPSKAAKSMKMPAPVERIDKDRMRAGAMGRIMAPQRTLPMRKGRK